MGISEMASGRKDLFMIDPSKLTEIEGWNVRQPGEGLDEHIRWLADSIKEKGVLEPLTVYLDNGTPVVTNGHCRMLAIKLAKDEGAEIKAVPVRVEDRNASEGDRILSLLTRNSGRPLSAMEKAEVIKRLFAHGWTKDEVCQRTSYSPVQIDNFMMLSGLPPTLTDPIKAGEVSSTLVVQEVRARGKGAAAEAIKEGIKDAKAKGKKKATKKNLSPVIKDRKLPLTKPTKTDWEVWGPKFRSALKRIISDDRYKGPSIDRAVEVLDEYEHR